MRSAGPRNSRHARQSGRGGDRGDLATAADRDVDRGTRIEAVTGKRGEEARGDVGRAEPRQLAVRVDLVAAAGPEAARRYDARTEADEENRGSTERDHIERDAGVGRQSRLPAGRWECRRRLRSRAPRSRRPPTAPSRDTTTTTGPGTGSLRIRAPWSTRNIATPSASEGQWISPALPMSSMIGRNNPSDSIFTPVSRPI